MVKQSRAKIKKTELAIPKNGRKGNVKYNGEEPLPHEKRTIRYLSKYGFDIETIIPSNIPGSRNPDILMMGTFWEMKGPISINENTIKNRFKKAKKQADGRAIFDLRNISSGAMAAESTIINLFITTRGMHRIIIIEKNGKVIDITK